MLLASTFFAFGTDILGTKERTRAEERVDEELDRERAPLDATMVEDWPTNGVLYHVLDRRLTSGERSRLRGGAGVDYVAKTLKARPLAAGSCGAGCGRVRYFLKLSSQKAQDQINVTDFSVRNMECAPVRSADTTLFVQPSGESSPPTPLSVDLSVTHPTFMMEDVDNGGGVPYRRNGGEVLGSGAKPSTFAIDVDATSHCTWTMELSYLPNGSDQGMKPFVVKKGLRGEPIPENPAEEWFFDGSWREGDVRDAS
ncbi:hypothetical protein [Streptomyces acidiscabies]|uniref:hypothetical protein n=1 Tax=Streptomyces acidiscabies TaxID=42234 RepID=UPI000A8E2CCC|nr:hypothetical protein [Streptomyces acidiscabies]